MLAACTYVTANAWAGRDFWFFWDELTLLWARSDQPLWGILDGHMGNWMPLGRASFLVAVEASGNSYLPLIAINSAFALTIGALLWIQLVRIAAIRNRDSLAQKVVYAAIIVTYLIATGQLYNVQWPMQIAWLLSVCLVLTGSWLVGSGRLPPMTFPVFVVLSGLALSSNVLPITLAGLALVRAQDATSAPSPRPRLWRVELLSVGIAVGVTCVGLLAANVWRPKEAQVALTGPNWAAMSADPLGVIAHITGSTLTWITAPIGLVTSTYEHVFATMGNYLWAHAGLAVAGTVALLAAVAYVLRTGESDFRLTGAAWQTLAAVVVFATMTTGRGFGNGFLDAGLARRYDSSLLLISCLFVALLLTVGPPPGATTAEVAFFVAPDRLGRGRSPYSVGLVGVVPRFRGGSA